MKKEDQERLMGDVGGTGKYNGTPPSNYCPSVKRFGFISEHFLCEKCDDEFENEAEVMNLIRSVHDKDVRKMFASDAIEHLEADQEYDMWLNAITIQGVFFNSHTPLAATEKHQQRSLFFNCITFSLHFFRIGVRTSLGLC